MCPNNVSTVRHCHLCTQLLYTQYIIIIVTQNTQPVKNIIYCRKITYDGQNNPLLWITPSTSLQITPFCFYTKYNPLCLSTKYYPAPLSLPITWIFPLSIKSKPNPTSYLSFFPFLSLSLSLAFSPYLCLFISPFLPYLSLYLSFLPLSQSPYLSISFLSLPLIFFLLFLSFSHCEFSQKFL